MYSSKVGVCLSKQLWYNSPVLDTAVLMLYNDTEGYSLYANHNFRKLIG